MSDTLSKLRKSAGEGGCMQRVALPAPQQRPRVSLDDLGLTRMARVVHDGGARRSVMKRGIHFAVCALFISFAAIGCNMEVIDEPERESESAQVASTEQAMPFNCVGICAWEYRACVRAGGDYESCAAEREGCKAVCDEQTCEPGEPGCCQGQPTCW